MSRSGFDPAAREYEKFYNKIRANVSKPELDLDSFEPALNAPDFEGIPEEKIYGNISKDEFQEILVAYDTQQTDLTKKDQPVNCSSITGGSYQKLLFSKQGFHHLGSTSYLVRMLGLKDSSRNSFLGGLSSYEAKKNEEILSLRKFQNKLDVKLAVQKIEELLIARSLDEAKAEIDRVIELDREDADLLAVRGKYYYVSRRADDAIRILKRSLFYGPTNPVEVSQILSDQLYTLGTELYHRQKYKEALETFQESLTYNNQHQGAILHLDLCRGRLKNRGPFSNNAPTYRK